MSDLQFIIRYIKYKLFSHSRKGHGIHSPFVYDFIEKVLIASKNSNDKELETILNWHKELGKNSEEIKISEVGAGSRKGSVNIAEVGKMVRKTGVSPKYGKLLWSLIKYYKPESVIEFGTGMGVSATYIARANPESAIQTIEGDTGRFEFAVKEFQKLDLKNIKTYNQDFDDFIAEESLKKGNYAVLLDGNHREEPTLRYFSHFATICDENSFIVFDDINWSMEMQQAWKSIIKHPSVSISIDMFFMGIVYFRKGLPKQHFVVNF